ncbi:methyl-accepting chemotaxis protein [Thalassospira sp.]|uniref:methyl-accepting chemotaxis protein n=1 Tax=Thalassospira sp. TaxID=1912094 RepID=UPI002732E3AB|nr:methyl-accepting chemotaxis protein [Thalassospira sp.]MDP2699098.1 methyl-accepting chemotaxis protein [Thalassospira sp.]
MSALGNRLELYNVAPATFAILKQASDLVHSQIPNRVEQFYDRICQNEDLKTSPPDPRHIKDLRQKLTRHWTRLFNGDLDADFLTESAELGRLHAACGITPKLYIAGYNRITDNLIEGIIGKFRWNAGKTASIVTALTSVMLLDIELTLTAYCDAASDSRHHVSETGFADKLMDRTMDMSIAINQSAVSNARMMHSLEDIDQQAQSISAAVDQMVAGINGIAQNSQIASRTATDAIDATHNGQQTVRNAVASMKDIAGAVSDASDRVSTLADASRHIGEIVQSIEEIASQTNLLALNATIEAARAGDAGKGFAVVANEVKNLASQTARATEEIRQRIATLQEEMQNIVGAMNRGTGAVTMGQQVMDDVAHGMEDIGSKMTETTRRIEDISAILGEQTGAANAVSDGVTHIAGQTGAQVAAIRSVITVMGGIERLIDVQVGELVGYDIPNRTIRSAKAEHAVYCKKVAEMLAGLGKIAETDIGDAGACRFGKWLNSPAAAGLRNLKEFEAVKSPHTAQHQAGINAIRAFNTGNMPAALTAFADMEKATHDVIARLDALALAASRMTAD